MIDAMTPLHLAVLLGAAGLDIAGADTRGLHRQRERQGELAVIVHLEFPNWKGQGALDGIKKVETAPLVFPRIQPQDAVARAVIDGRVLIPCVAGDRDVFDIDLDTVPGPFAFKQFELARPPFSAAVQGCKPRSRQIRWAVAAATRI